MINKLVEKIKKTKAPIVVGLDPMLSYIPQHVQEKAFAEYGETLEGAAEAIWQFNKEIVDKTYDLIPAVKPQVAMYEQFGVPGIAAFKKTVDYCKSKDLVVIGDIKRGDIGSSSNGTYSFDPTFTFPRCPTAYAADVEPISPLLISPITTRSFDLQ